MSTVIRNSYDTIGNGTRDFPACSAVLQSTAQLQAPIIHGRPTFHGEGPHPLMRRPVRGPHVEI